MNSKTNWRQIKTFCFGCSSLSLLLAATDRASAAITIKDTNYSIPSGAFYVSPTGSSTSSGKSASAPTTVAKALSSAPSGGTIVFRGGTYRNISSTISRRLTLQAYPHEQVWIKGSIVVSGWVADGKIWRKDGWTYSFPNNVESGFIDPGYRMAGYRDMVYVNGTALKQVSSKSQVGAGKFYVDSGSNKLYIGNNPSGKTVESTARTGGFAMWKSSTSNASSTVIRGLGFAHYAEQGVTVGAPYVKLENNTFVWNGVQGIIFRGQNIATDAVIRGNTFSYNGRKGVAGYKAHRMLLENNTISYNNVERFTKTRDAAGVKILETDDLVWRNNIVDHNYATGMWMDVSVTDATVVDNVARYNEGMGIFFETSHRAIIAGNLSYKNKSPGIMLSNSSSARVYNNTLADNSGANMWVKDTTRNNSNKAEVARGITWIARNNVIKNNIFSNSSGEALLAAANCGTKEPSSLMISAADHNAYYRKSSNNPNDVIKWSLNRSNCSTGYTSISDFKSGTGGYEEHALAIDNVSTNPFFIDEGKGKYQLKSGSKAIGHGASLPADVAKAIGLKAGTTVDLGATQSQAVLSN